MPRKRNQALPIISEDCRTCQQVHPDHPELWCRSCREAYSLAFPAKAEGEACRVWREAWESWRDAMAQGLNRPGASPC